jgi:predicted metal-dependent TIM-barrel fold hydrolase
MWFDALLHGAGLRAADVELVRSFGLAGALVPSGDAFHPVTAAGLAAHWGATAATARRLRRAGLPAWAALGVHPRRIPRRGLAERIADLPGWLSRPEVAAVGPVGLDQGGAEEEEVFLQQATLAAELRLPLLVRAGWRTRARQVGQLLDLLEPLELEPSRVLVLHADARTLPAIRARGHRALVALSGADGVTAAARLVARHGPEGIVLGSDAGDGHGDPLALPRVADRLARDGLSLAVIRRVCRDNALAWLGLEPGDLAEVP